MHVSFSKHSLPSPENLALWNKMLFIILLRRDHNTTITSFSFLFLQTPTHMSKSSLDWTITKSGACQMVSKELFPTPYSVLTHQREIYLSCIWSKIIKNKQLAWEVCLKQDEKRDNVGFMLRSWPLLRAGPMSCAWKPQTKFCQTLNWGAMNER